LFWPRGQELILYCRLKTCLSLLTKILSLKIAAKTLLSRKIRFHRTRVCLSETQNRLGRWHLTRLHDRRHGRFWRTFFKALLVDFF
jgi:hypothetical protein